MDQTEKAFDFASETSKLLITLSTGIVAILMAFLDHTAMLRPENYFEKCIIVLCWFFLLGSAVIGVWTQLSLTHVLEPSEKEKKEGFDRTIRNQIVKYPFRIQIITFMVGIITTIIYGIATLFF